MPSRLLMIVELACVALVVAGVALIYVPAALIVAGILGYFACEWGELRAAQAEARSTR